MDGLQETLMQSLFSAKNEINWFAELSIAANKLGFDFCAYGIRTTLPISKPKVLMLNNYSQDWQQHYIHKNYLTIDPTVLHGMRSVMPLVWTDNIFSTCKPFWEEARFHGLQVGWAQSCHDAKGVGGLLSLARSHDELTPNELNANSLMMSWLTQVAHEGMSQRLLPRLMPEMAIELSVREIEVLQWTAEGKTSADVGEILNIAERTVNFHINNAMVKLDVCNKTAAAIKAAILGLL
ncbi:MAG: LuxR family transcriptional regulator [Sulfuriferula sp.]